MAFKNEQVSRHAMRRDNRCGHTVCNSLALRNLPWVTVVIINLLKSLTTVVADKACSTEHTAKPSLLEEIMYGIMQRDLFKTNKKSLFLAPSTIQT